MQHAARYAAAIEILDEILGGVAAERSLTNWARGHRFAGSKDRAAIRDIVFDVLRNRRSCEVRGGAFTGRGLVLGLLREQDTAPETVFGAGGHAPDDLTPDEHTSGTVPSASDAMNIPHWLHPQWHADLRDDAAAVAQVQCSRAPVTVRMSTKRCDQAAAIARLASDDIEAIAVDGVSTALHLITNARRLKTSQAYLDGWVDLQDASSQRAVAALRCDATSRVLDYCAGGGGKALAIADIHGCAVTAHDVDPARTADIAPRAARAGLSIDVALTEQLSQLALFDVVFCDAPCSGSGTWRRTPQSKWNFSADKLSEYNALQRDALSRAAQYVAPNGTLVYATCSVLNAENEAIVETFCAQTDFAITSSQRLLPDAAGDGFYWASLTRQH